MSIYLVLDRSLTLPDFDILEQLRERLSGLEHLQWAHLTEHILNNATEENILRWKHQMDTPYDELPEEDKNKDREWANKVLLILMDFITNLPPDNLEYYCSFAYSNKELCLAEGRKCGNCPYWKLKE